VVACKRTTIESKPDLCQGFVGGLMEGLKYVYLNPEKSAALHIESVKEFQGGSVANQKVIEYGQAVSTALGVVPAVRQHGLGYMDPELVATTAKTVETYMGVKNKAPVETLFSNKFVGPVQLTEAQWAEVEKRSEKYLPRKSS
jgi:NitT/TauT family transport system substrate-binding protein